MTRKNTLFEGLPLIRLPVTRKDTVNNRKRNVYDLGSVTAARLFYECDIMGCRNILYCGKVNKVLPLLRYYTRTVRKQVVLLTPDECSYERTGMRYVFDDFAANSPTESLPAGNGHVFVRDDEAAMDLVNVIMSNTDRAFVFCATDGLQIDEVTMNALARTGSCFIVTDMLQGAVRNGLAADVLVGRASVCLFDPSSDAERFLIPVLPKYEREQTHNNMAFGYNSFNASMENTADIRHMNRGFGINLSQSRDISIEPVVNEAQLEVLQENGQILIYNKIRRRVYTGTVSH